MILLRYIKISMKISMKINIKISIKTSIKISIKKLVNALNISWSESVQVKRRTMYTDYFGIHTHDFEVLFM